ncbi:MAG: hypothetical protein ILA44_00850 [Prevotella sp.]|nr:hypothetical protein [Prevotella sp.]
MKKNYMKPEIAVVLIATQQMLAGSLGVNKDPMTGDYGGAAREDDGDW